MQDVLILFLVLCLCHDLQSPLVPGPSCHDLTVRQEDGYTLHLTKPRGLLWLPLPGRAWTTSHARQSCFSTSMGKSCSIIAAATPQPTSRSRTAGQVLPHWISSPGWFSFSPEAQTDLWSTTKSYALSSDSHLPCLCSNPTYTLHTSLPWSIPKDPANFWVRLKLLAKWQCHHPLQAIFSYRWVLWGVFRLLQK